MRMLVKMSWKWRKTRSRCRFKNILIPLFLLVENVPDADGAFHHFVKKSGFALVDLQSVGIRDVLVVSVKEKNQVLINPFTMVSSTFFLAPPPPLGYYTYVIEQ